MEQFTQLFHLDPIAILLMCLVGFIGTWVALFSVNYMKGDSQYRTYYVTLACLIASVFIMVSADHVALFAIAWMTSNILLAKLMVHKSSWTAAYQSGLLTLKYCMLGFLCLSASLTMLYLGTAETSIQAIIQSTVSEFYLFPALALLLVAVMIQSSIWPFHGWLLSSLNSPTPVSAIMHAGLINGGGFLLYRFYPLFIQMHVFLNLIFTLGIFTAILGGLWKLMQTDIKRMLACSTMSQMGFMLAQCGLGLFPAAMAHVCFHGLFKAYLFLGAGSAAQDKRFGLGYPPSLSVTILSLLPGLTAGMIFSYITVNTVFPSDSHLILSLLATVAGTQLAITMMQKLTLKNFAAAMLLTSIMGCVYGFNVQLIKYYILGNEQLHGQPLNGVYLSGLIVLVASWLLVMFYRTSSQHDCPPDWIIKAYVKLLNASQPHPSTVTSQRTSYQYE